MADTGLEFPNKTVRLSAEKSDVLISNSSIAERVMSRIMRLAKLARSFAAEES